MPRLRNSCALFWLLWWYPSLLTSVLFSWDIFNITLSLAAEENVRKARMPLHHQHNSRLAHIIAYPNQRPSQHR
ncbi:hypothetical protein B0T26DRAFT_705722 [Lasiosphaeria miniovina]|uniref:Secreted protein n=1 Tax=Lasiosphaeria miniovina TaxID=1954250 RepID=A0AA40AWD8_9PEZI|nr:uncharacterized protein B0T26DRAFT_705722 [Lasiosphaeria miniovina]KAK0723194.1 hypothetical protein B0T26DRAFT_705722 [Lasiosphaeria miniovina]